MEYIFHSQDDQDDVIVRALRGRELEYHNYDLNAKNYEAILATMTKLPEVWPSNLAPHRLILGEQLAGMIAAGALSLEDYGTVTQLQFRDRVRLLLQTTLTEQARCKAAYSALGAHIQDKTRLTAAVDRLKLKIADEAVK